MTLDLKNLTKERAIEEHRKMWNWIADESKESEILLSKNDYFVELGIDESDYPRFTCFLCEYSLQQAGFIDIDEIIDFQESICSRCPLDWGSDDNIKYLQCMDKHKYYDQEGLLGIFLRTCTMPEHIKYAREIASLPEKRR